MSAEPQQPDAHELENLHARHDALVAAYQAQGGLNYKTRKALLGKLLSALRSRQEAICAAVSTDYGGRAPQETRLAEIWLVVEEIKHARRHLREWMEPQSAPVAMQLQPATARIESQPLGVVGIIAPWNYPVQLALAPLVAAISAGNRVLLKPSEFTPATATVLGELIADVFPPTIVSVVEGGPSVGAAFAALPFDHLLFTGSTQVGRLVMQAAARNLTPVTLELGGKSPAILHDSFPVGKFAERVVWGKTYNAGQTCIAPDYVLVPRAKVDAFCAAFQAQVARFFPTLADNPDYTAIINSWHLGRLQGLLDDAESKGATLISTAPKGEDVAALGKLAPTLVVGGTDEMGVLQDEIFGPILPVVPYDTLDDAIAYVNARPRPLALYYFDRRQKRIDHVTERTVSGGVTVNDVLLHITQGSLPFGGVGPAGMGAYHGYWGFQTFSHQKSVFQQSRLNAVGAFNAPYGKLINTLQRLFIG